MQDEIAREKSKIGSKDVICERVMEHRETFSFIGWFYIFDHPRCHLISHCYLSFAIPCDLGHKEGD